MKSNQGRQRGGSDYASGAEADSNHLRRAMRSRLDFFDGAGGWRETAPNLPEGFHYRPELIGPADEAALSARVRCRFPCRPSSSR